MSAENVHQAALRIPRQRNRGSLERAAGTIERWLDAQDPDVIHNVDELWRVSQLALADASDEEIDNAVRKARYCGWQWKPIAMLLDESVEQVQRRAAAMNSVDGIG